MALYNKQKINSLAGLRQEKLRLRHELERMSAAGLISSDDLANAGGQTEKTGGGGWFDLAVGLLTSRTTLDSVFALGLPLLRFFPQKTQRNFLRAFVREFFGGYLKWKGMSWGFRILRSLLRTKQV